MPVSPSHGRALCCDLDLHASPRCRRTEPNQASRRPSAHHNDPKRAVDRRGLRMPWDLGLRQRFPPPWVRVEGRLGRSRVDEPRSRDRRRGQGLVRPPRNGAG